NAAEMRTSQEVAAAVALRTLGKKVTTQQNGAVVSQLEPGYPAAGKLRPTDVIVAIDGKPVRNPADVARVMSAKPVGTTFRFTVDRDGHATVVPLKTVSAGRGSNRGIVGVLLQPDESIRLPIPVSIDAHGVGGPSAGLAFALDVL